jgi:hypothetical protein
MDLSIYLPNYPDFEHTRSEDTLSILGSNGQEISPYLSISRKNEFYETKLESVENKPEKRGEWMKHQIFMSRFIGGYTPYSNMLLMHEPGTGKSCTSVAVIETIRKNCKDIKGALVLMTGDALIQNYKNEIVDVCTDGIYLPKHYSKLNKRQRQIRITKNLDVFYEFQTYDKFSNLLQEWPDEYIKNMYSNKVIILDEVHNLRQHDPNLKSVWSKLKNKTILSSDEKRLFDRLDVKYSHANPESVSISIAEIYPLLPSVKRYTSIYKFLHTVTNCKILLLSGTPMRDQPDEIIDIMNLILPERLEYQTYFNNHAVINEQIPLLKQKLKGKVSYLKAMKSDVLKEYIKNDRYPIDMRNVTLYGLEMGEIQSMGYNLAKTEDSEQQGIYSHSRQASLFVLPDYSYGKKAYEQITRGYNIRQLLQEAGEEKYESDITPKQRMLRNLRKYSCKYAECISKFMEFPEDLHFVYTEFVRGSGAMIFKKILDSFSFEEAAVSVREDHYQPAYDDDDDDDEDEIKETKEDENEIKDMLERMGPKKRYAILTGDTSSSKKISMLTKLFNHPMNKDGKYIQIVIGSSIISEGFTLKNVQHVHILTPEWNFSTLDQVIARSHRLFSHDALKTEKGDIRVKIYLYCAVCNQNICEGDIMDRSIDYRMISGSIMKDQNIKTVERVLKEVSVDCYLNKERNQSTHPDIENGTRECEYQNCDYQCYEMPSDALVGEDIDYSTYNLYYDEKEIAEITRQIIYIFSSHSRMRLEDLIRILGKNEQSVLKTIYQMIIMNTVIMDRLGNHCFLRSDHDYLYLIYKAEHKSAFFDHYYVDHFPLQRFQSGEMEYVYFKEYVKEQIENIEQIENLTRADIDRLLPEIQEMILEACFEGVENPKKEMIKKLFSVNVLEDRTVVSRGVLEETRCKPFGGVWQNCTHKEHAKLSFIRPVPIWDIMGQIDKNGALKIWIPSLFLGAKDERARPKGLTCGSGIYQKEGLIDLFMKLSPVDDDEPTRETIDFHCEQILKRAGKTKIARDKWVDEIKNIFTAKYKKPIGETTVYDWVRYLYWDSIDWRTMCEKLKNWLFTKNLLFDINGKLMENL